VGLLPPRHRPPLTPDEWRGLCGSLSPSDSARPTIVEIGWISSAYHAEFVVSAIEVPQTVVFTSANTDIVQSESRTRLYTFLPCVPGCVRGLRASSLLCADWSELQTSIRVCCFSAYTDIRWHRCQYTGSRIVLGPGVDALNRVAAVLQ